MGTGVRYHAVGDVHDVSKASVFRAIYSVVRVFSIKVLPFYAKFPKNIKNTMERFCFFFVCFGIRGMAMVCGFIDGTLNRIDPPRNFEEAFVDRHGNHSISCMVVYRPDMDHGSTFGARVIRKSVLFHKWQIVGDPLKTVFYQDFWLTPWCLIPPIFTNQDNETNKKCLKANKSTRRINENAVGILKEKCKWLNYLRSEQIKACF